MATSSSSTSSSLPNRVVWVRNEETNNTANLKWCGQCIWGGLIVCDARVVRLTSTESYTQTSARQFILDSAQGSNCATTSGLPNLNPPCIPLDVFCGECMYANAAFDCTSRVAFMMGNYQLSEDASKSALLEMGMCMRDGYDVESDPRANLEGCGESNVVPTGQPTGQLYFGRSFCGECMYRDSSLTCDEKAVSLSNEDDVSLEEAKTSILSDCVEDGNSDASLEGQQNDSSKLSTGGIIGIIFSMLALLLLCALLMLAHRRRKIKEEVEDPNGAVGVEADLENGRDKEGETASNVGEPKPDPDGAAGLEGINEADGLEGINEGRSFKVGDGEWKPRAKSALPRSRSIIAKEYVGHLKKKQDGDGNDVVSDKDSISVSM